MVSNMCEMQGETWRLVCTPKQLIGIYLLTTWVSLNHDGTDGTDGPDGTDIQSVSPVPSASAASPSVPSVSNSRSN